MCGQGEMIPCGQHAYLLRFPTCPCPPSPLYLCTLDASQSYHEAKAITLEDANTLLLSNGLHPLENPHDHGLGRIEGLELPEMNPQGTGRDNAREAQAKREIRREEAKLLIKTREKKVWEAWELKRLLRMAEIRPRLTRLAKNFIMHRTAESCETQLSKLKVHNTEKLDKIQREILREDLEQPEIMARFDSDVADAVAKYP